MTKPAAAAHSAWFRIWSRGTLLAALTLTTFEALLLQRRKSFFTGGFLTDAYTQGGLEAIGFLFVSLCADIAVAGTIAALFLALTARFRLKPGARLLSVYLAAAAPLLVADFLLYRLLSYLGDAFDLWLMFDLTGRRPEEMLAVAGQQLVQPSLLVLTFVTLCAAAVGLLHRVAGGTPARITPVRVGALAGLCGALLALAGGVSVVRAASETFDDGIQRKPSGQIISSLLETVSDIDRDGYGLGGNFADPSPVDSRVHPFALDVPGNGLDEDGVGGDLPADVPAYTEDSSPARFEHRPNLVLILLESFRADALGRVVDGHPVTPSLSALAGRGIAAASAYSHNGYTAQSRYHTLSGSLAGIRDGSLIDDFKANGYEVAYFSGQDESFGGSTYDVGFERADVHYDARQDRRRRYTTFTTAGSLAVPAEVVLDRLDAFLSERRDTRPLFVYLNFHDTHFPYHHDGMAPIVSDASLTQAQITPGQAATVRRMYYNAAANVDRAIGSALSRLEHALGAPPAVIVLSDHGESLFDHGFLGHGYALNDEQTRIPLVAAGLPLSITQPFAQVELRDAIAAALCRDQAEPPRVTSDPDKAVFQYLGRVDRPRQIAFTGENGRLVYDFRTGRVTLPGESRAEHPESLSGAARERFLALIRLWERMAAARAVAGRSETD